MNRLDRRRAGVRNAVLTVTLAGALFAGTAVVLPLGERDAVPPSALRVEPAALDRRSAGDLVTDLQRLQDHLRLQPRDARAWAALGLGYIEQARITADPTRYPKAEEALERSLREQPADNSPAAAGSALLAGARHDFSAALRWADRALVVNPYDAQALAARTDALVELGRYDEARRAAAHADDLRPGLPTFTRLAYLHELHGDPARARVLLERGLESASSADDIAFTRFHLGELALRSGDPAAADRHYAAALRADPGHVAALAGQARVAARRGDTEAAVSTYRAVVARRPLAEHVIEFGELLQANGRHAEAQEQYAVVRAMVRLATANGVGTDLETALFEADHGDPAAALASARAEWGRRHSIHAAAALGQALHATGRNREALPYLRAATRLGTREPRFHAARGLVEAALGRSSDARRSLRTALAIDPHFSPLHAPTARRALARLETAR